MTYTIIKTSTERMSRRGTHHCRYEVVEANISFRRHVDAVDYVVNYLKGQVSE